MAWYPQAQRVPADRPGIRFSSPIRKVGHHKTVSNSENAKALYRSGYWPNFTVGPSGVQQHITTARGGYAFKNLKGGVPTNAAGVTQIEIVGYPGVTMPEPTAWHLVALLKWLESAHPIPWVWPNGMPRQATEGGRDPGEHNRSVEGWRQAGHFGHSQVPENTHWDPAYTDVEWWWLNAAMNP